MYLTFQADDISGFHTNTHIPVVIGAQMRYEVTGDPLYKVIFFICIPFTNISFKWTMKSVVEYSILFKLSLNHCSCKIVFSIIEKLKAGDDNLAFQA